ncbi:hypothetical protein D9M68_884310 [compost metagenome]
MSTATRASSSSSKARKAPARASAVGRSTALRTSGRSMIRVVTGPFFSIRMFMGAPFLCGRMWADSFVGAISIAMQAAGLLLEG